jgi:hypothetical protein
LVRNDFYVEKLLCNDAAKIVIDEEFKNDLKNRVIFGDDYKDITKSSKHKNNFKQNRYFKIASGFVICVFVSGTILKAIDVQSKSVVVKSEGKPEIMSMVGPKDASATVNKELDLLKPNVAITVEDIKNDLLGVAKPSKSITQDGIVTKDDKKGDAEVNNNVNNVVTEKSDEQINQDLVKPEKNASVSIDSKGPIEVPKMDDSQYDTAEVLKAYDSRYSNDGKKLVSVKYGGIYIQDIATSKEKKIVAYNEKTHIIDKPNFTPSEGIIYYKAEKNTLENGAIYLTDKNGEKTTKIADGKNPMISKDGKKIVYEVEGNICIQTLASKEKVIFDNGNYPAFSDNGKLISYVKVENGISNLWVYNLVTQTTRSLTSKETNIDDSGIQSWAQAVRNSNVASDADIKYSYFESIWSSSNKVIYAIRKNNDAQVFELIKFNLEN